MRPSRTYTSLLALVSCTLVTGCFSKSGTTTEPASTGFAGSVSDGAGLAVAGATVFLIPTSSLNLAAISAEDLRDRSAENRDEPLEDAVAASGPDFLQDVTDVNGEFSIDGVPVEDRFYVYVEPAGTEYIPGGSWCRDSVKSEGLRSNLNAEIKVSSSPSDNATYVGMSSCLVCHQEHTSQLGSAHRLGYTVPGKTSTLQKLDDHPEVFDGNSYFLDGTAYTDGTPVYMYDPDFSRGFDDFKTSMTPPAGTVYAILWLWKDASGAYLITIENVINPLGDAMSPATREVKLNYGGGVKKQRYMIDWPGRNGLYPLLQYQSQGDEGKYDRTRRQFRDYHLDFFWDNNGTPTVGTDDVIKTPDVSKNISRNCLGCHAPGYEQYLDPVTNEVLCDSVEDPGAEFDIDGDGLVNDLNVGCETCHGPGSEHVANKGGRFIVAPQNITPSREVMICDRCHDRIVGNGPFTHNDIPMDPNGKFPPPGISRAEYVASYVTTYGPAASKNWPDDIHAKSHHQQVPDFYKSKHYRNPYHMITCSSCHDLHGGTGNSAMLIDDPNDLDQALCQTCHESRIGTSVEHSLEMTGAAHGKAVATCVDCHMIKTAKTGAGDYGALLGAPTGTSADDEITYFENDITSHVFDVPRKSNVGVAGVTPAKAMPIPYTQSCGSCHDPSALKY